MPVHSTRKRTCLAGCIASLLALAAPVEAQQQAPAAEEPARLAPVIVTAQRREASLQETPIAVSVFSAERLAASQIDSAQDLQFYTPGLVIADFGIPQVFIRGIGSNTFGAAVDPSATIHLDGVYLSRAYPAFLDFVDVARVEVLRGPQGTLYGRNSTAGTINIISQSPADQFEYRGDLLYGSYNRMRVRGTVSGPLGGNGLRGLASVSVNQRDGLYDNTVDGSELDDEDTRAARVALAYEPSESLSFMLRGDYLEQRETGGVSKMRSTDPMLLAEGAVFPADDYDVALDQETFFDVDHYGASLEIAWQAGATTLKSTTAYRKFESRNFFDTDGTNLPIATGFGNEKSDTLTQEFQLQSAQGGAFTWILGAYYLKDDADNTGGTFLNPVGAVVFDPLLIPPEGVLSNFDPRTFLAGFPSGGSGTHTNETEAYAAYADATWHFTPALSLTGGLRYSYETKDTVVDLGFGVSQADDDWDAVTPRLVLGYAPSDQRYYYASLAQGFKSGGFNPLSTEPFDPEYVNSVELGAKLTLADGRVQANIAVFYSEYEDFQVQVLGPTLTTEVRNAGQATTRGVELEFQAIPVDAFRLNGSIAWLDAEYDEFSLTDIVLQLPVAFPPFGFFNFPILSEFNQAGTQMFNAPEWTLNLGAEYRLQVSDRLDLGLRAEYQWIDEARTSRLFTRDSHDLLNLSLSIGPSDGRWSVMLFGRNVLDETYLSYGSIQPPLWGRLTSTVQGEPRTWGVQFKVKG